MTVATPEQVRAMIRSSSAPPIDRQDKIEPLNEGSLRWCTHCDYSGSEKSVKAHAMTHNINQCEFCYKSFKQTGIGAHRRWCSENPDHVEIYRCEFPGCKFTSTKKFGVNGHMSVHKYAPISPAVKVTDIDFEDTLNNLFPQGIPVAKIKIVSEWIALTKEMVS